MSGTAWLWRGAFLLLVACLLATGILLARFESWRVDRIAELGAGAEVVETGTGPQQYAERGEGIPVLIVHGTPGGYDQSLAVAEGLGLDEGFRVIAPSRPGYLGTPLGSRLLPEQQAADLVALLDSIGLERAAVVGFSTGGPAAVQLAARHPERVSALILASALVAPLPRTPSDGEPPLPEQVLRAVSGDIGTAIVAWQAQNNPGRLMEAALPLIYGGSAAQREVLLTASRSDPSQMESFIAMARSVIPISPREAGSRNDLLQFRALTKLPVPAGVPMLVIHGSQDTFIPLPEAREFAARVPGSLFVAAENTGHLFWIGADGPRAAMAAREFLLKHSQPAE